MLIPAMPWQWVVIENPETVCILEMYINIARYDLSYSSAKAKMLALPQSLQQASNYRTTNRYPRTAP